MNDIPSIDTIIAELEFWANAHAPVGHVQAAQVARLLGYIELLEVGIEGNSAYIDLLKRQILSLADRCEKQSELLSRRAEVGGQ